MRADRVAEAPASADDHSDHDVVDVRSRVAARDQRARRAQRACATRAPRAPAPGRARRPRSALHVVWSTIAPAASVAPSRPSVPAARSAMPRRVVAGLVQHTRRRERELLAAAATRIAVAPFGAASVTVVSPPHTKQRVRRAVRRGARSAARAIASPARAASPSSRSGAMLDAEPRSSALRRDAVNRESIVADDAAGDVRERRMRLRSGVSGIVPRVTAAR